MFFIKGAATPRDMIKCLYGSRSARLGNKREKPGTANVCQVEVLNGRPSMRTHFVVTTWTFLFSFNEVFPYAYCKQRRNQADSYISKYFHLCLITLILYEINIPNPTKSKNKFTLYTYKIELKPKYCP